MTFTEDLMFLLVILAIPAIAQFKVTSSYKKYSKIKTTKAISGQEVAQKILKANGLDNIYVVETKGTLSDHYDPKRKVVRLSHDIFHGESVSSMAVAAHEVGHAIQDKEGYFFMKLRSFIFPIVNLGTGLSYIIILIGVFAQALNLIYLGIALTALGLIFQIITLPVEFNASSRAKEELNKLGLSNETDNDGISKMLSAAALTYVAGVLASALQIVRLLLVFGGGDE